MNDASFIRAHRRVGGLSIKLPAIRSIETVPAGPATIPFAFDFAL
jgi:hypothetical protein